MADQKTAGAGVGAISETRLPNGLVVIVQEDHRVPSVSMAIRYDAGERSSTSPCVVRLAEIAMQRRTRHVGEGQYEALLKRAWAATWSWQAIEDAASFNATVPSSQLALPLWLWSDQMGFFDATDERLLALSRPELREQVRASGEMSTAVRALDFANDALFPEGHPYRHAACDPAAVDAATGAAVQELHDTRMTPDHAPLAIVGDVKTSEALALGILEQEGGAAIAGLDAAVGNAGLGKALLPPQQRVLA